MVTDMRERLRMTVLSGMILLGVVLKGSSVYQGLISGTDLLQKKEVDIAEVMSTPGAEVLFTTDFIQYEGLIPGYWVKIQEARSDRIKGIALLVVVLCPLTSGPDCTKDEISAALPAANKPWSKVYCGGIDVCAEQVKNVAHICEAVIAVRKPERIKHGFVQNPDA